MRLKSALEVLDRRFLTLKVAERAYQEQLAHVRKRCKHSCVGEWQPSDHSEELRICLDCGAEEGGWSCGFTVLGPRNRQVQSLTRDEFFARRKPGRRYLVGQD